MARNPDTRKSGYGLNPQARIVEKSRIELKTGYDANRFEQKLLRMYRSKRLLSEDIRHMMKSGHSECFPVSMKKELIGALQNRKRKSGSRCL